jgi:drug/metabolite transporter (DMT)-like permease
MPALGWDPAETTERWQALACVLLGLTGAASLVIGLHGLASGDAPAMGFLATSAIQLAAALLLDIRRVRTRALGALAGATGAVVWVTRLSALSEADVVSIAVLVALAAGCLAITLALGPYTYGASDRIQRLRALADDGIEDLSAEGR